MLCISSMCKSSSSHKHILFHTFHSYRAVVLESGLGFKSYPVWICLLSRVLYLSGSLILTESRVLSVKQLESTESNTDLNYAACAVAKMCRGRHKIYRWHHKPLDSFIKNTSLQQEQSSWSSDSSVQHTSPKLFKTCTNIMFKWTVRWCMCRWEQKLSKKSRKDFYEKFLFNVELTISYQCLL